MMVGFCFTSSPQAVIKHSYAKLVRAAAKSDVTLKAGDSHDSSGRQPTVPLKYRHKYASHVSLVIDAEELNLAVSY